MDFLQALKTRTLFFDGAMGTLLQAKGLLPGELPEGWVISKPDVIREIHAEYCRAGADIIKTCTFGCNAHKLAGSGLSAGEVSRAAAKLARQAVNQHGGYVALDVGPTGRLLRPLGDLDFEDAVALFRESISAGSEYADLVLIETMTDAYELKAAVVAARECCKLPICATVSLDGSGRMLTGADMGAVVALLEGMRVEVIGLNCGCGPDGLFPHLEKLLALSSTSVAFNPNAGLPQSRNGVAEYSLTPNEYAAWMQKSVSAGVRCAGGCCGTTPEYIRAMVRSCKGIEITPVRQKAACLVSGCGCAVSFECGTVLIGERINPTGKPKLKEALRRGDHALILQEAIHQQERGAKILDVNAGLPDIDEPAVLEALVKKLQGVCDLPLQIDTADPAALERALRIYNGKPMINSVTGAEASMNAVLPLAHKYGALIVALTLDENGIPETAQGRVTIARRIMERAATFGIQPKDIIVDALTMTASASPENVSTTLETMRRVRSELGLKTILGVSNVSFGLPNRELLNAAFFTLAQGAGLSAAIINPYSDAMMDAFRASEALLGRDAACGEYIGAYAENAKKQTEFATATELTLEECVYRGLVDEAAALSRAVKGDPLLAIDAHVIPALDRVGKDYESGALFLPGLLRSAEAAKAALAQLCPAQAGGGLGEVIVATVQGDVHDIGKNIVASVLSSYRYRVVDLGRDVSAQRVLDEVKARGARLVGLSALMTTTVASMRETVALLREEAPDCRIMVGGAVLTEELARDMGADRYVRDAMASVSFAREILG